MNILENIAKSHKAVKNIENQLFNVVKMPLYTGVDDKFTIENGFGLFKENGGTQLGIVGKDFNPSQPSAIFEAFCDASLQSGFDIDELKYFEMKEGKKVRFSIPIAKISFTNVRGVEDTTDVILNVQTGFDGNTATSLYLETYRLICTNGMKKTFTEFKAKFRNTNGNEGKIAGMLADVTKCVSQVDKLEEMYIHLNSVKVNQKAVDKYIQSVFGYDLDKYSISKEYENIVIEIKTLKEKKVTIEQTILTLIENEKTNTNKFFKLENELKNVKQKLNNVSATKDKFFTTNKVTKKDLLSFSSLDIIDDVKECIEWEFKETGATAFGLFNGITHYTNHFAKGRENNDYLFTEQGARTNDKALKEILVMVK
jgi:hypothetical protein